MEKQRISRRGRRNLCYSTDGRKVTEKSNCIGEKARLERKRAIYDKQEMALKKMQKIVVDQMMKVEVEGLQLAANLREKEEAEFTFPFEEATRCMDNNQTSLPQEIIDFDDTEEVNKVKLDLDACLEEMLFSTDSHGMEEEEEDELKFQYLQQYKSDLS